MLFLDKGSKRVDTGKKGNLRDVLEFWVSQKLF